MGNGITNCYPDEVDNFISITVLSRNGLFAVLNVGAARAAICDADLRIEHMPTGDDCSHAGIYTRESLDIAVELQALVAASVDVHPAVVAG